MKNSLDEKEKLAKSGKKVGFTDLPERPTVQKAEKLTRKFERVYKFSASLDGLGLELFRFGTDVFYFININHYNFTLAGC